MCSYFYVALNVYTKQNYGLHEAAKCTPSRTVCREMLQVSHVPITSTHDIYLETSTPVWNSASCDAASDLCVRQKQLDSGIILPNLTFKSSFSHRIDLRLLIIRKVFCRGGQCWKDVGRYKSLWCRAQLASCTAKVSCNNR